MFYGNGLFAALLLLLTGIPAFGSYDQPIYWSEAAPLDVSSLVNKHFTAKSNLLYRPTQWNEEKIAELLKSDLSPEMPIPPELLKSVGFWLRIYTELTTQQVAIFDSRNLGLVYEVLDFNELSQTARSPIAYEITRQNTVKKKMRLYREALARLARNPNPKHPTVEEQNILREVAELGKKPNYHALLKELRGQTGQRDSILRGMAVSRKYFPKMELLFTQLGIPPELTRLSLVESSFNPFAVSYVGASGVWQFMLRSGKEFMKIDERLQIDERRSVMKSTLAAAQLLIRNKTMMGSWPLAITSYNHGYTRLPRNRSKDGRISDVERRVFDPLNYKSPLGWASRNYYASFLAVVIADRHQELFYQNIVPPAPEPAIRYITLQKSQTALQFMMENGILFRDFKYHNPDVINIHAMLPKGFTLAVSGPQIREDDFSAIIAKIRLKSLKKSLNLVALGEKLKRPSAL